MRDPGCETGGRLVGEDQLRISDQGSGYCHAAGRLSAGELPDQLIGLIPQAQGDEYAVAALGDLAERVTPRACNGRLTASWAVSVPRWC